MAAPGDSAKLFLRDIHGQIGPDDFGGFVVGFFVWFLFVLGFSSSAHKLSMR